MSDDEDLDPIDSFFGLTYSNYLVLNRTLLQSMPQSWQARFVGMLEEMRAAFDHVEQAEAFEVTAGIEREVFDLSEQEMELLGIVNAGDGGEGDFEDCYYDRKGNELRAHDWVIIPCEDPISHYNRGRARIEPRGTTFVEDPT